MLIYLILDFFCFFLFCFFLYFIFENYIFSFFIIYFFILFLFFKNVMKDNSSLKNKNLNSKVSIHSFKHQNSILKERKNCIDKLDELINNFISNKTNKVK